LLKHPGIDVNYQDNNGRAALHNAVWGKYGGRLRVKSSYNPNDSPECALLLLERGADPNLKDGGGNSPLCVACGTNGFSCIDLLVKNGADVNLANLAGNTPLHEVFFRANTDCLDLLLKHSNGFTF